MSLDDVPSLANPVINSPYDVPSRHFEVGPAGPTGRLLDGRRPSESFIPVAPARKGRRGKDDTVQEALLLTHEQVQRNSLINELRREVEIARVGQFERQLLVGHRHVAAARAVDDRDRAAPVALARNAPVAQAELHFLLAQAFGSQIGSNGVDGSLIGEVPARAGIGKAHGRRYEVRGRICRPLRENDHQEQDEQRHAIGLLLDHLDRIPVSGRQKGDGADDGDEAFNDRQRCKLGDPVVLVAHQPAALSDRGLERACHVRNIYGQRCPHAHVGTHRDQPAGG